MMNGVVDKLCSNISSRNLICFGFIFLIRYVVYVDGIAFGRILGPSHYTALSHDLEIEFQTTQLLPLEFLNLKLSYDGEPAFQNIHHINFYTDELINSTKIKVPCSLFTRAGPYVLHVEGNAINATLSTDSNHLLEHKLDVRWPSAKLSVTHEVIETYEQSMSAVIEFLDVECPIDTTSPAPPTTIDNNSIEMPSFQLELTYCGMYNVFCDSHSVPSNSTFLIQHIMGIRRSLEIPLNCEYFGLAGNYVLHLKPLSTRDSSLYANAFIKADWSKQYILNIMDIKSTYDCADEGIRVVVKYPACIMDNDRVRLYGRLPADVHSIARPTSLVYVNERKIERGQYNVYFNCELFNERFIEYCFVYVTEAKTGAVADIRSDCVPTSPIYGPIDGKWGRWSNWSECSAKYAWGIQSRYRICDSPTPKYNGKYCEGPTTETRPCSGSVLNIWEYFFGTKSFGNINSTEIMDEVGASCQCGCIIHLLKSKRRRLLATSTQACPHHSDAVWTIEVEEGHQIQFSLDYFVLPCPTQSIRVRDGKDLWLSELIGEFTGRGIRFSSNVVSSGELLLIDFHLNDSQIVNNAASCYAGFIGHVEVIDPPNVTIAVAQSSIMNMLSKDHQRAIQRFNLTHLFVFLFCLIILMISVFLIAQYIFGRHQYHLAKSKEEVDSPLHTPHGSTISITRNPHCGAAANLKAVSTSTLMSEVVTLVKLKPLKMTSAIRHQKLRESVASRDEDSDEKDRLNNSIDSIGVYSNNGSTNTLTNDVKEDGNITPILLLKKKSHSAPESDTLSGIYDTLTPKPKKKLSLDGDLLKRDISSNTIKEFIKEKSQKKLQEKDVDEASSYCSSMERTASPAATLTSGNYSPALSLISTARIRLNNMKESKEKRNREKLMTHPGSQYSISTNEEMEMDYYDYNVVNASAAPGSYLGMDPAYLVWIPPIDETGNIISDAENEEEIAFPEHSDIDPGSNQESPDEPHVKIPIKPPRKSLLSTPTNEDPKPLSTPPSTSILNPKEILSKINFLQRASSNKQTGGSDENLQQMSPTKNFDIKRISVIEKETSVIKSPSDNRICEYYELSDIKFADDDEMEDDTNENSRYEDTTFQVES